MASALVKRQKHDDNVAINQAAGNDNTDGEQRTSRRMPKQVEEGRRCQGQWCAVRQAELGRTRARIKWRKDECAACYDHRRQLQMAQDLETQALGGGGREILWALAQHRPTHGTSRRKMAQPKSVLADVTGAGGHLDTNDKVLALRTVWDVATSAAVRIKACRKTDQAWSEAEQANMIGAARRLCACGTTSTSEEDSGGATGRRWCKKCARLVRHRAAMSIGYNTAHRCKRCEDLGERGGGSHPPPCQACGERVCTRHGHRLCEACVTYACLRTHGVNGRWSARYLQAMKALNEGAALQQKWAGVPEIAAATTVPRPQGYTAQQAMIATQAAEAGGTGQRRQARAETWHRQRAVARRENWRMKSPFD